MSRIEHAWKKNTTGKQDARRASITLSRNTTRSETKTKKTKTKTKTKTEIEIEIEIETNQQHSVGNHDNTTLLPVFITASPPAAANPAQTNRHGDTPQRTTAQNRTLHSCSLPNEQRSDGFSNERQSVGQDG